MSKKLTLQLASLLLTLAAALHLVRSIAGWELTIDGWVLPVWVSIVVGLLAAFFAFKTCKISGE